MPTLSSKNKVPLKRTMENKDSKGLKAALELEGFRRLWIGQIFSQLADKFYIVLMIYLIAQYWVINEPQSNDALAGVAAAKTIANNVRPATAGPKPSDNSGTIQATKKPIKPKLVILFIHQYSP